MMWVRWGQGCEPDREACFLGPKPTGHPIFEVAGWYPKPPETVPFGTPIGTTWELSRGSEPEVKFGSDRKLNP